MSTLQPLAAPALERLVRGCMAKVAEERWESAHDLRLQLIALSTLEQEAAPARAAQRLWLQAIGWTLLAGLAVGVAAATTMALWRAAPIDDRTIRFTFPAPDATYNPGPAAPIVTVSPDGRRIAWGHQQRGRSPPPVAAFARRRGVSGRRRRRRGRTAVLVAGQRPNRVRLREPAQSRAGAGWSRRDSRRGAGRGPVGCDVGARRHHRVQRRTRVAPAHRRRRRIRRSQRSRRDAERGVRLALVSTRRPSLRLPHPKSAG